MSEDYYYVHKNNATGLHEVIFCDPGNGKRETITSVISSHRDKDVAQKKAHKLMLARWIRI